MEASIPEKSAPLSGRASSHSTIASRLSQRKLKLSSFKTIFFSEIFSSRDSRNALGGYFIAQRQSKVLGFRSTSANPLGPQPSKPLKQRKGGKRGNRHLPHFTFSSRYT